MNSHRDERPDPDALLAHVEAEEKAAQRGKLRIYFGSCAGVGKTYAMLAAALKLKQDGRDVVAGVVETHGRAETAALLVDIDVLPLKKINYRGKVLNEFDLDGALARRPALLLLDELAHSNVQGSRHPKRWQDAQELVAAGIDVFTTLNVQHLESLNDVVGGIISVRVQETVPDTLFDAANEIVLVDIPPGELLARLKAGKVYLPQYAERAASSFFRKGNLMALRELALRRTADRVEDDVQAYRIEKSINPVWKTEAGLLTCIGPGPGSERVVRAAARLANQLNAVWHAIYVETPRLQRRLAPERERILGVLNLATSLGATTAVIAHADIARSVIGYARKHNLGKIVIGRDAARVLWPWQRSSGQRIALLAPDIDLVEIGRPAGGGRSLSADRSASTGESEAPERRRAKQLRYAGVIGVALLTTLLCVPLARYFDRSNIVAIYLLLVVLVAVRWGRGPAALAAVLSVASFDFFFVPPRLSFAVSDVQYLLTFVVMLAVGLITGQLTAGLRFQARVSGHREERARALYEFARELSGAMRLEQVVSISNDSIRQVFRADAAVLLPDAEDKLVLTALPEDGKGVDLGIAQWAFDHGSAAGFRTDTVPGSDYLYVALRTPLRSRGVVAIRAHNRRLLRIPEQRQLLDTFAALIAIALERVYYVGIGQKATVQMESERLRNSILAALSHDLRTPLTVLYGLAESLSLLPPRLSEPQMESIRAIQSETLRMTALVGNLLEMARIESGEIKLNLQWQLLEEVIGSALRAAHGALQARPVRVELPPAMPMLRFDAILIERVFVNLLENIGKYTPSGTSVTISAQILPDRVLVNLTDEGPGFPPGREEAMFEKFIRGSRESALPGVGLGLAICRAVIQAHNGDITASNRPEGGAQVSFSLPRGDAASLTAGLCEIHDE